ncbi:7062_t:CDS:2 [Diversispora eburnea]|uniref:7062_t:CDS:1 n=1 Tax=Diversispora eburnea TaxID=1213867 RepID=A0A9N8YLP0_9GLOM|nr:7062_t:CDS:2 [Diversispora eburnea]
MTIQKQQEENVAILANTNKEDSPIYMEINNVMNEIEKFRERLHELSRIQQQQRYESLSDDSDNTNSEGEEKQLETNENMMKAVQNQLAIIRQHIGNVLDNCEMLDENLLTVIMTYNEEVNIALQEAFEEIPSLYSHNHPNFNNIFQLISDIEQCQELLHNYTKLKGLLKDGNGCRKEFNSELRLMEVKELLIQYECKTQILEGDVLQRLIIETILDHCDIYFNGTFQNSEIKTKRESILGLTKFTDFSKPLSKMNPEVYSVLGSKGYDGFDHPFIEFVAEKIVAIMNQYCIIESLEKKDQIKELSSEIVYSIINIFYFRMQAQEQPSQFRWIENGKKIDSETMKCTWDNHNKYDDPLVDICYFPLIGRKLINEDLLKVYSKAKVYPYRRPENLNSSDNLPVNLPE